MSGVFDLEHWSHVRLAQVEQALERWVTAEAPQGLDHGAPAALVEAMKRCVTHRTPVPPRPPCARPAQWN